MFAFIFHSNCMSLCGWLLLLRIAHIHPPSSESLFPTINPVKQTRPAFQVNKLIEIHVRFIPALLYFFPVTLFVLNSGKTEQIARVRSPKNQVLLDRLTSQPTFLIPWYRSPVCRRGKFLYAVFQLSFFFMLFVTPALIEQMTCYKITRKLQYCTTLFFSVVIFFLLPLLLSVKCKKKKKKLKKENSPSWNFRH